MKQFFAPNIGRQGRVLRFVCALLLLAASVFVLEESLWLGLVFIAAGAFILFEALRGWCALRACGTKRP